MVGLPRLRLHDEPYRLQGRARHVVGRVGIQELTARGAVASTYNIVGIPIGAGVLFPAFRHSSLAHDRRSRRDAELALRYRQCLTLANRSRVRRFLKEKPRHG